jgi:hypothetical protein
MPVEKPPHCGEYPPALPLASAWMQGACSFLVAIRASGGNLALLQLRCGLIETKRYTFS